MNPRDSSSGVVCAFPTTNSPEESTMNVSVIVPPASIASTRGSRPFAATRETYSWRGRRARMFGAPALRELNASSFGLEAPKLGLRLPSGGFPPRQEA